MKRVNLSASVYRENDGMWTAKTINPRDPTGQPIRAKGFTRSDALDNLKQNVRDRDEPFLAVIGPFFL